MDPHRRAPALQRRIRIRVALALEPQPERAARPRRLPGLGRGRPRGRDALQRRRRQHDPLQRALAAPEAGRFPQGDRARAGGLGRLADQLRRPRAVLRAERRRTRDQRAGRRPVDARAQRPPDPAAAVRDPRAADGGGVRPTRLALVARRQRDPHRRLRWSRRLQPLRRLPQRLPARLDRDDVAHLLAEGAATGGRTADPGARRADHDR